MSIITTDLYDCYDYIFGISKTECDCYDPKEDFELNFNTSYSGLYLDELAPLNQLLGMADDCNGTLWEIANDCREIAIKTFVADITKELLKRAKLKQSPYYGVLGRRKHNADRTVTDTHAGVHWFCKAIKSGTVIIKKIHTIFSETGVINLLVYDNFNALLHTIPLNTTQDTFRENDITDIELPLYSDYVDNLEYFFVYAIGANQPRNNELSCIGCTSRRLTFLPNRPYFTQSQSDRNGWANYIMCGGMVTSVLEFMDAEYGGNDYMNGLIFEVEFRCNIGEVVCMDGFDFQSDPLALDIAFAIRWKAAEIFADRLFASRNISFDTLIHREDLATNQAEWIKKYIDYIEHIGKKIDLTRNDCLVCDDFNIIGKSGILI